MNTCIDDKLRLCLIDLFTAVIEHKVTRPDNEFIRELCGDYADEVIDYLRDNRIGFYVKGDINAWSISIHEAQNALKKLI